MTSHLRAAEAAAGSDTESERSVGGPATAPVPTPTSADSEWDGYMPRKHSLSSSHAVLGVIRNDRTPLNTPYTPHLVKLQLKRHDEHEGESDDEQTRPPAHAVIATVKTSIVHLIQPLHHIRYVVDRALLRILPRFILDSPFFTKHRHWIVGYFTTVLCIPFVLLLSPMVIAFCICTSPIWIAGVLVLAIRTLMPVRKHEPLEDEYVHSPTPHRHVNGSSARINGGGLIGAPHHHRPHHRRAHYDEPLTYRRSGHLPANAVDG